MISNAQRLVLAALLAALVAAGAIFSIPLPPPLPPVTLAVFFALLSGLLLGPLWGSASLGLYLLVGSIGLPVFANASGGIGHFAGPTGGFLLGYMAAALCTGLIADRRRWSFPRSLAAGLAGIGALYLIGLPWFHAVLNARPDRELSLWAAFIILLPYLVGDIIKAAAAAALVRALKPLLINLLPSPAEGKAKA